MDEFKEEANRLRNPKVVIEKLTGGDFERERRCWEETSLELLKKGVLIRDWRIILRK